MRIFYFLCICICLFLLPAKAQNTRYSYELKYEEGVKNISGTFQFRFVNQQNSVLDTLWLHLPSRALSWKSSALHQQLLTYQKVEAHFAKAKALGSINISNPLGGTLCEACEFVPLVLNKSLNSGDSISFKMEFTLQLPDAQFNGIGITDEGSVRIAEWLPRLARLQNGKWYKYPVRLQNDVWPQQNDYQITIQLPADVTVLSNLTLQETFEKAWMRTNAEFGSTKNNREGLKTLTFKGKANDAQLFWSRNYTLSLYADSNFVATEDENSTWGALAPLLQRNINSYLESEGLESPTPGNILILRNKIGEYQNNGGLVILNAPINPFDFETDLMYAYAQQKLRYSLPVNGYNEAWVARGLPYFYKYHFIQTQYPEKKWLPFSNSFVGRFFDLDAFENPYQNSFLYLYLARQNLDQAMATSVDSLTRLNYEAMVEAKTFLSLNHLRAYVGERNFKRSMYRYIQNFNDSSTATQQLESAFDFYHNQPVANFFDALPNTSVGYDFALVHTDYCPTVATATVVNRGKLMLPYSLTGFKDGQAGYTEWFQPHEGKKTVQLIHNEYDYVVLNQHLSQPEFSQKNNRVNRKGIFRQMEPIRLQFYNSFERPDRTQIFWLPTANYNAYDKLLLGVTLSNSSLVQKRFEYAIGPEFSFGTSRLTGYGSLVFNKPSTSKHSLLRLWRFGLYGRYYHYDENLSYARLSPSLNFYFEDPHAYRKTRQQARIRGILVERELASGATDDLSIQNASYSILNVDWKLENISITKPYTLRADFQYADAFSRFDVEGDFRWMLPNKKWLIWRNFGGVFFKTSNTNTTAPAYYAYGLSGTQDYLFDYSLIGRSDETGIWSRQFFTTDGGFKSETNVFADNFMLTSNLSVPIYSFFGVFGDVGVADNFNTVHWDAGLRFAFLTDFLEVYLPLAGSQRTFINDANYFKNTRFVLDINLGNIINRIRRGYY